MPVVDSKADRKVRKKSRGRIILLLGLIGVAGGATAAGTLFWPRLTGATPPAANPQAPAAGEAEPDQVDQFSVFAPIVVDMRDEAGVIHHLKVGLAVELTQTMSEGDFQRYQPRGREAAIGYLRSLGFDAATSPEQFPQIRAELSKRVVDAIGKSRVKRVLVTDFVAR